MNSKPPIRICHITTVHPRYDPRIFVKECRGLAKNGYEVFLVVADGKGDEEKEGVKILDVGKSEGRIHRVLFLPKKALKKALKLNAEIYHFHDPELLKIGKKLVKKRKKVIYDSHEDLPRQVLDKAYIPELIRKPLSSFLERFEDRIVSKLSGVVTVTPTLVKRFAKNNSNIVEVRNFPLVEEFDVNNEQIPKENAVCYVGAISKVRGVLNMVEAMKYSDGIKLLLGGKFQSTELRKNAKCSEGWDYVSELGFLNREEVKNTLLKSIAGLVVLEPTVSYLQSIPVKMFEYMIAGIPVIASDFDYWKSLIQEEECALFVDPCNPKDISEAIKLLVNDKDLAKKMGARGKNAVLNKFNWNNEEKKLLDFYLKLLK
ncbi:MAG: glycosyltransferase family 4 protein [Maribacter arcticus]|uniref:glycosyltransferase family 4 protein n=1 Tax=Maribacter arcticus TaxID=561365 RepID=UPI0030036B86